MHAVRAVIHSHPQRPASHVRPAALARQPLPLALRAPAARILLVAARLARRAKLAGLAQVRTQQQHVTSVLLDTILPRAQPLVRRVLQEITAHPGWAQPALLLPALRGTTLLQVPCSAHRVPPDINARLQVSVP
eukprot:ANDGO_08341.mRNA.1 hypothetical protein